MPLPACHHWQVADDMPLIQNKTELKALRSPLDVQKTLLATTQCPRRLHKRKAEEVSDRREAAASLRSLAMITSILVPGSFTLRLVVE
jgi:hypothetical protein